MDWNAVPEIIATLVLVVILINSRDTHVMPSTKDRLFRFTLVYSICSFLLNIVTVVIVRYHQEVPRWINIFVNTAYFALYPLITQLFIVYILLYAFEQAPQEHRIRFKLVTAVILASSGAYLVLVGLNLDTGWIFYLDETKNYFRGPLNRVSLLLAIIHIIIGIITVYRERQFLDTYFFRVILWFPLISLAIVIIQVLYLEIILTGTALAIAILSVYLNFQTRRISIDNLTQYPNRETFLSNLESIVRHDKRATVLVASLDNFKNVNDTFGQRQGDLFLKTIADTMQQLCPKGQVYRYGGDELALITDNSDQNQVIDTLAQRFAQEWTVEGISARISASLALLELPFRADRSTDPMTLLDHTIRTAKTKGRGKLVRCDTMVLHTIRRRNKLGERLMSALSDESLSISYQPIFSLETGNMEMAEALLRMETEDLGTVSPAEFIPLAEELGIIAELGRWVLEQVCILLDEFRSRGEEMPVISVNFSTQQFSKSRIVNEILEMVDRYRIPEGKINLELTESTFIGASFLEANRVMEQLRSHGIRFHLDDFGVGYSNLSYMVNLPFRCIKLDKSLLWEVQDTNRMHTFIESMIKVVRQMDYSVIVEGVENSAQVSFLRRIGCDMVQGYHLCAPLSKGRFVDQLGEGTFTPLKRLAEVEKQVLSHTSP